MRNARLLPALLVLLAALPALVALAARPPHIISDEKSYSLPQMFHLDHYDHCLSSPGALYCSGTFKLSADKPSPTFDLMKETSTNSRLFDRTNLYRGYCVSRRCPSPDRNSTWRFEQCVQKEMRKAGLRATLRSYHCYTKSPERPPDAPERIFLGVVILLLFFNFLGSLYDHITHGKGNSRLLMAWSVRANWNRLTASYEDGDKRLLALAPIQGVRCTMVLFIILAHATNINSYLYLSNPTFIEKVLLNPMAIIVRNGSSMVQLFIVLSNFLYAYGLLIFAKEHKMKLIHLPLRILNRVVRLSPIHLGTVAYAATWWRRAGDGPQWDSTVGEVSDICRRKFWLHAFYLHNLFDSNSHCLLQTWYLAVDFQLYLVATFVLLILEKKQWRPIPVLTGLFFGTIVLNMALAYYNNWQALLYMTTPENMRHTFRDVDSFTYYYIKPWGSLPACFVGLLLAHIHYHVQETNYPLTKKKVFMWIYKWSPLLLIGWICSGNWLRDYRSPAFSAVYLGVERPVFAVIIAIFFLGACNNIEHSVRQFMLWRGWQVSGRLMLSITTNHWCVNLFAVASRRALVDLSVFSISGDALSTLFWSYLVAIPMTVLLEYPFLKTFAALLS